MLGTAISVEVFNFLTELAVPDVAITQKTNFPQNLPTGTRRPLHPAQCARLHAGPRLALVAPARPRHSTSQRPPDRGTIENRERRAAFVESKNGETRRRSECAQNGKLKAGSEGEPKISINCLLGLLHPFAVAFLIKRR